MEIFHQFDMDRPVAVHKNRKKPLYNILQDDRIVAMSPSLSLCDVTYVIDHDERERAEREHHFTLHALIWGTICVLPEMEGGVEVWYDPEGPGYFATEKGPIHKSKYCILEYKERSLVLAYG